MRSTGRLRFTVVTEGVGEGVDTAAVLAAVRRWAVRPAWAWTEFLNAAACLSRDMVD